jgi:hypothetical protein
VSASWILLDWSRILNEFFLLSDSHSQPRAKTKLRVDSNATFAEKFFLEKLTFDHMFRCIARQNLLSVTFAEKVFLQEQKFNGIFQNTSHWQIINAAFVENLLNLSPAIEDMFQRMSVQSSDSSVKFAECN